MIPDSLYEDVALRELRSAKYRPEMCVFFLRVGFEVYQADSSRDRTTTVRCLNGRKVSSIVDQVVREMCESW